MPRYPNKFATINKKGVSKSCGSFNGCNCGQMKYGGGGRRLSWVYHEPTGISTFTRRKYLNYYLNVALTAVYKSSDWVRDLLVKTFTPFAKWIV